MTPPVGIDGLSPTALTVLQAIRSHEGPVLARDICIPLQLTRAQWDRARATLTARGLIERHDRMYVAVTRDTEGAGASSAGWGERSQGVRRKPAPIPADHTLTVLQRRVLRDRVLDHLSRRPLTLYVLASHLNADIAHVRVAVSDVLASGDIVRRLDGTLRAADDLRAVA